MDEVYIERAGDSDWYKLVNRFEARYRVGPIEVCADVRNGKVFKIIAYEGYNGKLFNTVFIGMNVGEAMALEPRLYYDEVEEGLYVRGYAGVTADVPEVDLLPEEVPSCQITAISIYAEEAFVTPQGMDGKY